MAFCVTKLTNIGCRLFLLNPSLRAQLPNVLSAAKLCSKELMDPNVKKPAPFPYETKAYTLFHWHFDSTVKRFDENTKIVVVDGNIGAGKTAFAKHLAEVFGMKYVPEPDLAKDYITPYGYDLRQLDSIVPPSYKSCTIETFYKNPYDRNVTLMQFRMITRRYENYIDAIAHLLNTGQGIIMDRCVFSDFVFLQAMYKAGYVRKLAKEHYQEIYRSVTEELLRPHLIIYLDITPEVALQRIKQRNNEMEVNSKVLTLDYLSDIEHFYKHEYLKELSRFSEILMYDWNDYGDLEVVVEDIEKIDLDNYSVRGDKFKDWKYKDDWDWGTTRRRYTNRKNVLMRYACVQRPRVTEVYHPGEEVDEYEEIMSKVPGTKYTFGFNRSLGDSILFKSNSHGDYDIGRYRQTKV